MKTARQLKDKIKNMTTELSPAEKSEKSQMLMRHYFMEKFLERISVSQYKDNFILKGGMLVSSYTGLESRTTKDVDESVRNLSLTIEAIKTVLEDILSIDLNDNIHYRVRNLSAIMESFEYPGIRAVIDVQFDTINYNFQVDMSTNDIITPRAIEYNYKLMMEDRTISLLSYNLETLLAEKLQTIIARSTENTRLRDFYDIYALYSLNKETIDYPVLKNAFKATSEIRKTYYISNSIYDLLKKLESSPEYNSMWQSFQKSNYYIKDLSWKTVLNTIEDFAEKVIPKGKEKRVKTHKNRRRIKTDYDGDD